jgi:hypothetical protein
MSSLIQLFQALVPHLPSEDERDEAYLNQAVDLRDLERRMREVEARGRADTVGLVQGLFLQ